MGTKERFLNTSSLKFRSTFQGDWEKNLNNYKREPGKNNSSIDVVDFYQNRQNANTESTLPYLKKCGLNHLEEGYGRSRNASKGSLHTSVEATDLSRSQSRGTKARQRRAQINLSTQLQSMKVAECNNHSTKALNDIGRMTLDSFHIPMRERKPWSKIAYEFCDDEKTIAKNSFVKGKKRQSSLGNLKDTLETMYGTRKTNVYLNSRGFDEIKVHIVNEEPTIHVYHDPLLANQDKLKRKSIAHANISSMKPSPNVPSDNKITELPQRMIMPGSLQESIDNANNTLNIFNKTLTGKSFEPNNKSDSMMVRNDQFKEIDKIAKEKGRLEFLAEESKNRIYVVYKLPKRLGPVSSGAHLPIGSISSGKAMLTTFPEGVRFTCTHLNDFYIYPPRKVVTPVYPTIKRILPRTEKSYTESCYRDVEKTYVKEPSLESSEEIELPPDNSIVKDASSPRVKKRKLWKKVREWVHKFRKQFRARKFLIGLKLIVEDKSYYSIWLHRIMYLNEKEDVFSDDVSLGYYRKKKINAGILPDLLTFSDRQRPELNRANTRKREMMHKDLDFISSIMDKPLEPDDPYTQELLPSLTLYFKVFEDLIHDKCNHERCCRWIIYNK